MLTVTVKTHIINKLIFRQSLVVSLSEEIEQ
uniref:Uncharacterized protein n=1 Tax=Yersinia pseudotuberculosis serotype O:3 (strain YPIII) TaxID=502800 RepID=A0A0H3B7E0_YERPY